MRNNHYWLYAIECVVTGQVYVGQTLKPNPCMRWMIHINELRNKKSCAPLLQAVWNKHPTPTKWRFQVLDEARGARATNYREAELILEVPEHLRLNEHTKPIISIEKHRQVEAMLLAGRKYDDIHIKVGVSTGLISKIKRAMECSS